MFYAKSSANYGQIGILCYCGSPITPRSPHYNDHSSLQSTPVCRHSPAWPSNSMITLKCSASYPCPLSLSGCSLELSPTALQRCQMRPAGASVTGQSSNPTGLKTREMQADQWRPSNFRPAFSTHPAKHRRSDRSFIIIKNYQIYIDIYKPLWDHRRMIYPRCEALTTASQRSPRLFIC